jgi:hypothetical protein
MDKHKGIENPEAARAAAERAQSNAWGTHADKRTKRERTRADAKRAHIERDNK